MPWSPPRRRVRFASADGALHSQPTSSRRGFVTHKIPSHEAANQTMSPSPEPKARNSCRTSNRPSPSAVKPSKTKNEPLAPQTCWLYARAPAPASSLNPAPRSNQVKPIPQPTLNQPPHILPGHENRNPLSPIEMERVMADLSTPTCTARLAPPTAKPRFRPVKPMTGRGSAKTKS